jgi:hypothetical protein
VNNIRTFGIPIIESTLVLILQYVLIPFTVYIRKKRTVTRDEAQGLGEIVEAIAMNLNIIPSAMVSD